MELLPVESSHIEAIGYDGDTLTLAILYKTGKLYVHPNITATQFGALMTAPSKGAWVARFLKGGAQKTETEQRAGKFRSGPLTSSFPPSNEGAKREVAEKLEARSAEQLAKSFEAFFRPVTKTEQRTPDCSFGVV